MPPTEIPGYYWDEGKQRYFKVERSGTAPIGASWSSESVKQAKLEAAEAAAFEAQCAAKKLGIRRHEGFYANPLGEDLLRRRIVGGCGGGRASVDGGAAWASGLVAKGRQPTYWKHDKIVALYVHGDETELDTGAAFVAIKRPLERPDPDDEMISGLYLPTDANASISPLKQLPSKTTLYDEDRGICSGVLKDVYPDFCDCTSLRYHEPSNMMLCASHRDGLRGFNPCVSYGGRKARWHLGYSEVDYHDFTSLTDPAICFTNSCCPAPAASNWLCVTGTCHGPIAYEGTRYHHWCQDNDEHRHGQAAIDVDFQHGSQYVVFASSERSMFRTVDWRVDVMVWVNNPVRPPPSSRVTTTTRFDEDPFTMTKIRSISHFHVLTAGLNDAMAIYDIRSLSKPHSSPTSARPAASPVVAFPEYRNAAHLKTGWDVSRELGVVAAAQDDNSVGLFSLRSGRKLKHPVSIPSVMLDTPVEALQFQTQPGERLPSLFVAEGASIHKYSFGTNGLDDEA